jgi:hypothetical protein
MRNVFRFLASQSGRWFRIFTGALIMVLASWFTAGVARFILVVIGFLPFIAGAADICLFAPLFNLPISGRKLREKITREEK